MATKYICDGCDREFAQMRGNLAIIDITIDDGLLKGDPTKTETLDLCTTCKGRLNRFIRDLRTLRENASVHA